MTNGDEPGPKMEAASEQGGGSRRHHIVPAFYLAGFTESGERDSMLTVTDVVRRRVYRSKPDNVAHRRDFNRLLTEGADPLALEDFFAAFEARSAPILRDVIQSQELPKGEALESLLLLLAVQVVRSPSSRDVVTRFVGDVSKMLLTVATSSEERWAAILRRAEEAGHDVGKIRDFERVRAYAQDCDVRVSDNDWVKGMTLEPLEVLAHTMLERNWYLLESPKGCDFVTSDHPLTLMWTDDELLRGAYPPGFGMSSTRVMMPLSPRLTLIGEFEGPEGATARVDEAMVAHMNSMAVQRGTQAYSPSDSYPWSYEGAIRRGASALLDVVQSSKA